MTFTPACAAKKAQKLRVYYAAAADLMTDFGLEHGDAHAIAARFLRFYTPTQLRQFWVLHNGGDEGSK